MANDVLKNPSFQTDINVNLISVNETETKNSFFWETVLPIEKLAKSQKNRFSGKLFLGQKYIFEINIKKIFYTPTYSKKKSFHLGVTVYFLWN